MSSSSTQSIVTVADLNTDFLPLIYDIIRSIEKETGQDNPKIISIPPPPPGTGPGSIGTGDANAKMAQLKTLFENFRENVPKISGIGTSREEQLHILASLRQQLIMKRELIMKYKSNCIFENLKKQLELQQQQQQQQQQTSQQQSIIPPQSIQQSQPQSIPAFGSSFDNLSK